MVRFTNPSVRVQPALISISSNDRIRMALIHPTPDDIRNAPVGVSCRCPTVTTALRSVAGLAQPKLGDIALFISPSPRGLFFRDAHLQLAGDDDGRRHERNSWRDRDHYLVH